MGDGKPLTPTLSLRERAFRTPGLGRPYHTVMAGLVPAIHGWRPGAALVGVAQAARRECQGQAWA